MAETAALDAYDRATGGEGLSGQDYLVAAASGGLFGGTSAASRSGPKNVTADSPSAGGGSPRAPPTTEKKLKAVITGESPNGGTTATGTQVTRSARAQPSTPPKNQARSQTRAVSSQSPAASASVPGSSLDTSVLKRATVYRRYIREIEGASGLKISGTQRKKIIDYLRQNGDQLRLLDNAQANRWSTTTRRNLVADWTKTTQQQWPTYSADVISPRTGRPFIRAGHSLDAHEIIPNQLNAPHKWWNVVPVRRPDMHQALIHARDSAYRDLIGLFE